MRKILLVALGFFIIPFMISGCGDDKTVRGPEAVEFSADNAVALAEIGVGTVNLFASMGRVLSKSLDMIPLTKGSDSPSRETVYDIGFCFEGNSILTWTDTDDDDVLSAGDSAEVAFENCAWDEDALTTLSNGSFNLSFSAVDATSAVVEFSMNYMVAVLDERDTVTTDFVGLFTADADWGSRSEILVSFLVNTDDHEDPTIGFAAIEGGKTQVEFGCFDLDYAFDTVGDGFTLSQPSGVYRIPGAGFLSIISSGIAEDDLDFPDGDYPDSGRMALRAEALPAPCAALALQEEGVKDNNSFLDLAVTVGGEVSLSGEDATGEPFEFLTTWDILS